MLTRSITSRSAKLLRESPTHSEKRPAANLMITSTACDTDAVPEIKEILDAIQQQISENWETYTVAQMSDQHLIQVGYQDDDVVVFAGAD